LPSKNLIAAARIVHEAAHPSYPGLLPTKLDVDFATLIAQKDDVVHAYRARYASVADGIADLEVVHGDAAFIDPHTVRIGESKVSADRILIATGSRPTIPPIPGLADVPYVTSDLLDADEAQRLDALPEPLVVLGGAHVRV